MDTTDAELRMEQSLEHLHEALKKVRTGRASSQMLEAINVDVYGAMTPLNHLANILSLDAQTLQVQPFDPNNLAQISAAIRDDHTLGLNPSDDGKVVRVSIPPMTEERRREVVKAMGDTLEKTRISLRNVRHDVLGNAKKQEKEGEISQDDLKGLQKNLDAMIDGYNRKIEEAAKAKEHEILSV